MLDRLKASGFDVISVGKINDIFASRGVTDHRGINKNNADGMEKRSNFKKRISTVSALSISSISICSLDTGTMSTAMQKP